MGTERPSGKTTPATSDVDTARTFALLSRMLERSLDEMTLPQFRVLMLIARAPERANRIAAQAAVSRPSLTGVLDGLVARGWVERLDVEGDRRGVQLDVTADGRQALDDAKRAVAGRLDDVLALIEPDRRAVAEAGLAALGEALSADLELRRAAKSAGGT